jgi:hypothetical protein
VLKRRSTDDVVAKAISDNFRGWTAQPAHRTVRNGMTLVERLAADKRKQRNNPAFSMGLNYYKELKREYSSSSDPTVTLQVTDQSLEVSKELLTALVALKGLTGKRQPMFDWLARAKACNQKELIGILRMALEQRPTASERNTLFCIAILRYLVKSGLDKKFEKEMKTMKAWADAVLTSSYTMMKRNGVALKTWWQLHTDVAWLVMPSGEVEFAQLIVIAGVVVCCLWGGWCVVEARWVVGWW